MIMNRIQELKNELKLLESDITRLRKHLQLRTNFRKRPRRPKSADAIVRQCCIYVALSTKLNRIMRRKQTLNMQLIQLYFEGFRYACEAATKAILNSTNALAALARTQPLPVPVSTKQITNNNPLQ